MAHAPALHVPFENTVAPPDTRIAAAGIVACGAALGMLSGLAAGATGALAYAFLGGIAAIGTRHIHGAMVARRPLMVDDPSTQDFLRRLRQRMDGAAFAFRHGSTWIVMEADGALPRMMSGKVYREFRLVVPLVNEITVARGSITVRRLWGGSPDSSHTGCPAVLRFDSSTEELLGVEWYAQGMPCSESLALTMHKLFLKHHEAPDTRFDGTFR